MSLKVWQVIDEPSKWIQHNYALTGSGHVVLGNNPEAICWCLAGAIYKCYDTYTDIKSVWDKIQKRTWENPISWNDRDGRTWEEVYQLAKELDI